MAELVEMVQVTRCKDCRYFCREIGTCTNLHGMYEPEYEGYCSYAERKKRCEE